MSGRLPRVSLLGDSIRLGYEPTVRSELAGLAEVWSPEGNGMHSVHHLFNLHPFYLERATDVIHFNFGLWDCRRLGRNYSENAVPVELFARNLDFILGKVGEATTARMIWATLTPVVQNRYNARFIQPHEPCRAAADVERYNAFALPILERHGVMINDLHALVEREGREQLICEDGIHYTKAGAQLLGLQVATAIRQQLNLNPSAQNHAYES